jgi:hypothetical protein
MEEFKFPHEREEEAKAQAEEVVEFEVEGEEKPEIEVVDDTPEADRNRKPMQEPPKDVTDEELSKYDEGVRKRIQHFTKGYHEERRAKEAALREREEALKLAQNIIEENKRLKGSLTQNQAALIEQAKKASIIELAQAKVRYKQAYESGDSDQLVAAQEQLTEAKMKADRLANLKPPVQKEEDEVKLPVSKPEVAPAAPAQVDERAAQWQQRNSWFGQDHEMTSFALGVHSKLVESGIDPTSDEYYKRIDNRLRQVFPDQFESEKPADAPPQRSKSNVAPATRSTAPKKIVLTQSQVNIAKRLGVPLEAYAKQVAEQMRK